MDPAFQSLIARMLRSQEETNELLEKLVEAQNQQNMDDGTGSQVEEPMGPEQSRDFMKSFGKAVMKATGLFIALGIATQMLEKQFDQLAKQFGGTLPRELATVMKERYIGAEEFADANRIAMNEVINTMISEFGILPDPEARGMGTLAELRKSYGIDIAQLIEPSRWQMAVGAADSFYESFDQIAQLRQRLADRGVAADKAFKVIGGLPELVVRLGSVTDDTLARIAASSLKLGVSAKQVEASLQGLSADGFDSMVENIATLQTLVPGLSIDFGEF